MFTLNFDFTCLYCGEKINKNLTSQDFKKTDCMQGFNSGKYSEFAYFQGFEFDNCIRTTCKKCFAFYTIDVGNFDFHACEGFDNEISEYPEPLGTN